MDRGLLLFLISMSCIGLGVPLGGVMMETFPVWLFTCITIIVATLILVPIATIYEKTKWTQLGLKNYFGIFMQALLTVTLYTVFQLYGLTYASPVAVGIITSITPAVVAVLALFLLRERLNMKKGFAILLAIIAVLIMNVAGVEIEGGSNGLGILFMLLAVVSMSLFFIYAKKFSVKLPPITLAAGLCFFGIIQTLPMAIYEFSSIDVTIFNDGAAWLGIFFYAMLAWVLAYVFTFLGIPRINASTAGMATAAIPVVSTIAAVIFFGEAIRIVDIIALILVLASIFIAESQEKTDAQSNEVPPTQSDENAVNK
ncbi:DMT family transporter [Salibacterium sp. K-3]